MLLTTKSRLSSYALAFLLGTLSRPGWAHVKWFSDYRSQEQPIDLTSLANSTIFLLLALSLGGIFTAKALSLVTPENKHRHVGLHVRPNYVVASAILRAAAIASIVLAWHSGILLAPELKHDSPYISGLQLVAVAGIAPRYGGLILAACIFGLFALGIHEFGLFHMLDYVVFVGLGCYFLIQSSNSDERNRRAVTALYLGVGLSLCWAALEKLVYPQWSAEVVALHPELAMGLPVSFFVSGAAFVEFSVGFLIATQTLPRIMAVLLTGLMAFTATLFGMIEVIGHLIFHAILLCFILIGPVKIQPQPYATGDWRGLGIASARHALLFVMMLGTLLSAYISMARALS